MPIFRRTETHIDQCCAACGAERQVPNTTVQLKTRGGSRCLTLPPCACGAIEVLLPSARSIAYPVPGTAAHLHRLAVDELAARVSGTPLTPGLAADIERWLAPDVVLDVPKPPKPDTSNNGGQGT